MSPPPAINPSRGVQTSLLALAALTIMSGATIAPALPEMQAHFAQTPNAALLTKLALTVVGLVIAVSAPFSGWLVDRVGRRRVLLVSLVLYALGGASGLLAPSLGAILLGRALLGRALLGLAVGGIMISVGALINDLFSGPARGRFLSLQAASNGFGGALLLPLAGALAAWSWRAPLRHLSGGAAAITSGLALQRQRHNRNGDGAGRAVHERRLVVAAPHGSGGRAVAGPVVGPVGG